VAAWLLISQRPTMASKTSASLITRQSVGFGGDRTGLAPARECRSASTREPQRVCLQHLVIREHPKAPDQQERYRSSVGLPAIFGSPD
jgi:hypothetical protein